MKIKKMQNQPTPTLGNTQLAWFELTDKICPICSNHEHTAMDCPIKQKAIQRKSTMQQQAKSFGTLYQRYKPAGTANIRKILPRNNQPTYAQIAKTPNYNSKTLS